MELEARHKRYRSASRINCGLQATLTLKECVTDLTLENRLLKKSMIADGDEDA